MIATDEHRYTQIESENLRAFETAASLISHSRFLSLALSVFICVHLWLIPVVCGSGPPPGPLATREPFQWGLRLGGGAFFGPTTTRIACVPMAPSESVTLT